MRIAALALAVTACGAGEDPAVERPQETAHMAHVLPDDSALWVANIGVETLTEIALHLDAESFEVGEEGGHGSRGAARTPSPQRA
ncbi:MAG: hypothetical protein WD080_12770 [Egibacteraceae bacterium]